MTRKFSLQIQAIPRRARVLAGAAMLGAALLAAPTQAATIDFEGYGGPAGHGQGIQTKGFNVVFLSNVAGATSDDFVGTFIDPLDPAPFPGGAGPTNNPTTYYAAVDDAYVDIMATESRTRFNIKSFDASFVGGTDVLSSYPATPGYLRLQGYFANGSALTETYALLGVNGTGFDFAHFTTSASFGSQNFVEVIAFGFGCATSSSASCTAFTNDRAQFALDNIDVRVVPEPASMLLVGLGLAGLISARRRKA